MLSNVQYVLIYYIFLQNENQMQFNSVVQVCNNYTNLTDVLSQYQKLLKGKLHRFKEDIKREGFCPGR